MEWATSFKVTGVKDEFVSFLHPVSRAVAVNTRRTGARIFLIIQKGPLFAIILYVQCMRNAGKGAKDHAFCSALTQHEVIGITYSKP